MGSVGEVVGVLVVVAAVGVLVAAGLRRWRPEVYEDLQDRLYAAARRIMRR